MNPIGKSEKLMFIDLLRTRRSIRKYQKKTVEKEKIDILIEAALRSFSSRNSQPLEFVAVTERDTLARLADAKTSGSAFLKDAPLAIVVCADTTKSDVWIEDASIAATLLHLTAADIGLGSCWIQIRLRQRDPHQSASAYVASILGIREGLEVEAIVAIGYPTEHKEPQTASSLKYETIRREHYGKP